MNLKNVAFVAGLLASTSAFAADLPARSAPASSPLAAFSWTGAYVGVNAGGGLATTDFRDRWCYWTCSGASLSGWGLSGGVTAGYNVQMGQLVTGLEADVNLTSLSADYYDADWTAFAKSQMPWFATVRARAGVVAGPALAYLTAGVAIVNQKQSACSERECNSSDATVKSSTQAGLAVGAGVEYALSRSLSVKGEYLFMTVPDKELQIRGFTDTSHRVNFQTNTNLVRLGVNYRF